MGYNVSVAIDYIVRKVEQIYENTRFTMPLDEFPQMSPRTKLYEIISDRYIQEGETFHTELA